MVEAILTAALTSAALAIWAGVVATVRAIWRAA
jgi:hypothetical protein